MHRLKPAFSGQSSRRRRVLLLLEWFEYEIHRGVAAYAHEANWVLDDVAAHAGHIPLAWNGNGIIALLCTDEKSRYARFATKAKCPVVDLTDELPKSRLPRVVPDNEAIGRLGAEHLLSRGFKHLAFYQAYEARVERERMKGFRAAVLGGGQSFIHIDMPRAPRKWQKAENRLTYLADVLIRLPKPLAVMAQYDARASEVVLACEQASLAIPEQVAVVGADNDPITSELGLVPLTSVDTNRFQLGYQGAALLDRLMQGDWPPHEAIRIPPKGIVVRSSSDILAVDDIDVAHSLRFIWDHFREPITVDDVVAASAVSRRTLYSLFKKHLKRTIMDEIIRLRLTEAKRLLLETDLKASMVALKCGFRESRHLNKTLQRCEHTTPSAFRRRESGKASGV